MKKTFADKVIAITGASSGIGRSTAIAFGHERAKLALLSRSRPELEAVAQEIRKRGGNVVREAGPMKHGTTVIAFVEDPDGYKIELIERF